MRKTFFALLTLTLCSAVGAPLHAQQLQGDFLVAGPPDATSDAGGGIFVVNLAANSRTLLQNLPADLRRISYLIQDPTNPLAWYAGTRGPVRGNAGPVYVYRFTTSTGRVLSARKLNTQNLTTDTEIKSLAIAGDKLIFASETRVESMPLTGGAATTLFAFARPTNNFPAMVSDGRYLYANIFNTGNGYRTGAGSIWRHDLQDLTKRVSLIRVDQFPTVVLGLALDASGKIYSVDKGNFAAPKYRAFDLLTKQRTRDVTLPWMALRGFMSIAVDPATDIAVINGQGAMSFSDRNFYSVIVRGTTVGRPFGGVAHTLTGVASRRTPGLVRRGFECASAAAPEFMSLATGSPNAGNANYSVDLVGPQNTVAIFLLGAGAPFTPVKLAPTNCELGLNPILFAAGAIPASRRLRVPLAIPGTARGFVIDTQWVALEASANPLGLVTRQVGRIFVR